ncbi:MAG TPA: GDP-mannose 4,6-dehydratase [Chitinophagales bacterium]|nr:GDP-mannose 4,6-dehydratase [Chitinophagales bacterium]
MNKAIITGISGQDGSYLAKLLLEKGYQVIGLVRSTTSSNLNGLNYLNIRNKVLIEECDLQDLSQIISCIQKYQPTEIYNLAAQSSVSLSFAQPIGTFHFNTISVFNLLEAIKLTDKKIKFYQASSSEMFGEVKKLPITEDTEFHPKSPYAISKAAAHWTCVNYRESYNLFICCGILFNHESYLRNENFFVKKIISNAHKIQNGTLDVLKVGDLNIKRDIGYAPKYIEAMYQMMQQSKADNYLICTGKSVSLSYIVEYIFNKLDIPASKIIVDKSLFRPSEIKDIYGSTEHINKNLNWHYDLTINELLDILLEEEMSQ